MRHNVRHSLLHAVWGKACSRINLFGGRRWWWICPLTKHGPPGGRRVGKLYLPPDGPAFGCRQCYEVTYTSYQESHKYDRLWWSTGFDPEVGRLLEQRYR